MDNINGTILVLKENEQNNMFKQPWAGTGSKTPKYDFFINNLLHFFIRIDLRGSMYHWNIFPAAPSYSTHIWTYIENIQVSVAILLVSKKFKVLDTKAPRPAKYTVS